MAAYLAGDHAAAQADVARGAGAIRAAPPEELTLQQGALGVGVGPPRGHGVDGSMGQRALAGDELARAVGAPEGGAAEQEGASKQR